MRGQKERDAKREKRTTTINMTCRNFPNGTLHIQTQSEGPWVKRKGASGRWGGSDGARGIFFLFQYKAKIKMERFFLGNIGKS
jgi:hypothetical protein